MIICIIPQKAIRCWLQLGLSKTHSRNSSQQAARETSTAPKVGVDWKAPSCEKVDMSDSTLGSSAGLDGSKLARTVSSFVLPSDAGAAFISSLISRSCLSRESNLLPRLQPSLQTPGQRKQYSRSLRRPSEAGIHSTRPLYFVTTTAWCRKSILCVTFVLIMGLLLEPTWCNWQLSTP